MFSDVFLQGYFINRLVAVPSLMRAILPSLQSPQYISIRGSLKLLVLSGEVLQVSLCKMLLKLLPHTLILNLYGSTEVRLETSTRLQALGCYSSNVSDHS